MQFIACSQPSPIRELVIAFSSVAYPFVCQLFSMCFPRECRCVQLRLHTLTLTMAVAMYGGNI
jgi:hypothetical protein